ncbi:MAG: hypothetical protein ACOYM3_14995 [Terrimicrobiaceae bacterium]
MRDRICLVARHRQNTVFNQIALINPDRAQASILAIDNNLFSRFENFADLGYVFLKIGGAYTDTASFSMRHVVAGLNYRMEIEVADGSKRVKAHAVVWKTLNGSLALTSWD